MRKMIRQGGGLLSAATGVIAVFCASLPGAAGVSPEPRATAALNVAHQADDGGNRDGGTGERPEKSEPTRSGLRKGIMDAELTHPREAVDGLAGTVNQAVTSPNRMIVEGPSQQVEQGQSGEVEVACPAPFKVVNGGSSNTGTNVRLTGNFPATTATGSAWHVRVRNEDPGPRHFRAYADCVNGLTRHEQVSRPTEDVAPGADVKDYLVTCPAGTYALGGGYSLGAIDQVAISASYGQGQYWILDWRNVGPETASITTYAICETGVDGRQRQGKAADTAEYVSVESKCFDPKVAFAGGWVTGTLGNYITVTDSYPTPDGRHIVWAHNHDGSLFQGTAVCAPAP